MRAWSMNINLAVVVSLIFSFLFFFSSRRRHTRCSRDWSSDVCSSDLFCLRARLMTTAVGVAGIVYMAVVIRRARRQKRYVPVLEDWLWHCAFPLIAYVTLLVAALVLRRDPPQCLLVIGATALLLLFIGIHNAWDAVTYIATQQPQHPEGPPDRR